MSTESTLLLITHMHKHGVIEPRLLTNTEYRSLLTDERREAVIVAHYAELYVCE